jgi:preprotein translocase subunit SecY
MEFLNKIKLIVTDKGLRNRILFVLGALVLFRLLAAIPIPGINTSQLEQFFSNNQFLGLLNIFSGGGLAQLSILMLGVAPYITGSIMMQLLTVISPRMKEMYHEEGEAGRKKIAQYSRLLTVPLAVIQGFGFITLFQRSLVIEQLLPFELVTNLVVITAGSILIMWIGELITEFGIGNGVSLIIFAGIVAGLPSAIQQLLFTFTPDQIPLYIGFLFASLVITFGVVVLTEAERPIPITYAKRVRGNKVYGGVSTYLPLRVNQAGVMPIIFALSILLFPQMILNFFANVDIVFIKNASDFILGVLENQWVYASLYFVLVFLFTYFYTAITFDPDTIATNLQHSGAFVPGVRPGKTTSTYIGNILTRLTLVGAVFLGIIAVLPLAIQSITGFAQLAIGGTGLLIVVSVVIDLVKKVEAQVSMREY